MTVLILLSMCDGIKPLSKWMGWWEPGVSSFEGQVTPKEGDEARTTHVLGELELEMSA